MNRYCTSPRARDTESSRTTQAPVLATAVLAATRSRLPRRQRNARPATASRARERVTIGWQHRSGSAASAVDHRPHESLTSDPKSRRRWPTAGLAKTPFKQLHPATTFNFKPPQIASMRSLLAVSSCANETRAKFGWRGQPSVRRLTFARGSLSTAVELGRASNHVPRRTTPRPQTPSRLTSRRYAGEPKLASRACSKLASRVLNYALILATLTPLSSWLTVAGRVLCAAICATAGNASHAGEKRPEFPPSEAGRLGA